MNLSIPFLKKISSFGPSIEWEERRGGRKSGMYFLICPTVCQVYFASLFQVCERVENVSEVCVRDFERFVISTVDTRNSSDVSSEGEEREREREQVTPNL